MAAEERVTTEREIFVFAFASTRPAKKFQKTYFVYFSAILLLFYPLNLFVHFIVRNREGFKNKGE